jgi:hypothetical protein
VGASCADVCAQVAKGEEGEVMPKTANTQLAARTRIRVPDETKRLLTAIAETLGLPQPEAERVALAMGANILARQLGIDARTT